MQEIIKFLVDNWQPILSAFLSLVAVILVIIKKRPQELLDGVRSFVHFYAAQSVNEAEKTGLPGPEKKKFAHSLICAGVASLFGYQTRKVDDLYSDFIDQCIEEILSTPQKKGCK